MRWEDLTAAGFRHEVREAGVCVSAVGAGEKHGEHLPLETDFLNVCAGAAMAAEKEPAVVSPPFYFGRIYEVSRFPGTAAPGLIKEFQRRRRMLPGEVEGG